MLRQASIVSLARALMASTHSHSHSHSNSHSQSSTHQSRYLPLELGREEPMAHEIVRLDTTRGQLRRLHTYTEREKHGAMRHENILQGVVDVC